MKNFVKTCQNKKKCKSCNINHISFTKMSYFSEFLSCILQRKVWTGDQNIDSYEEIPLLGKTTAFIKDENF